MEGTRRGRAADAVRGLPGADRAAALALVLLVGWLAVPVAPAALDAAVSGTAWTLAALWASWRCLRAPALRAARHSWRLLGIAAGVWAVACGGWSAWHAAAGAPPPFPSPADAGFLLFPLLAVVALLRFPGLPASATTRVRLLLDGAVVSSSLLLLAALAGMDSAAADGRTAVATQLLFVALDVLAGSVALLVLDRLRPGSLPAVRRAALAVLVVVLSDVVYSAMATSTGYTAGSLLDAAWCAGFLLLASAAGLRSAAIDDPRAGTRLLPAVPAAVAGLALVASGRLLQGLDVVLAGVVLTMGAALTARQVLLALENAALHRSLEEKVADRTDQLRVAVDEAHRSARTDALTDLPNRDGFGELLIEALAHARDDARVAVLLVDLDRFREVNDGLGHDVGDTVLQAAAARLATRLREGEVLARLGGDEFGVLLTGLRTEAGAVAVAERLVEHLREPLAVGPLEVVVEASVGVAVGAQAPQDRAGRALAARDLLRDADTAVHAAKADGGGTTRVFQPAMHTAVQRSLHLQVDLRAALAAGHLHVHYQPVVDLVADRVVGVEALARWSHPEHGAVPPLEFVAAAERSGLVVALERAVLDMAARQLAQWRRSWPGLTVAVNTSARHLREDDFLPTVMATLRRHGLPPSALVLEVTESLLFHDDEHVREVLAALHTAGVGLALDDFGTGYSSLSRLVDYPFDTLKVDRSFVNGIEAGGSGTTVLQATLAMARGLGMRVVAEGVETPDQLRFLSDAGCELAQGYLLSRPGPPDAVGPVLGSRLLPAPRAGDWPLSR